MKTLKCIFKVFVIAFLICGNASGQVWHQKVVVTLDEIDYGVEIGKISGTYAYNFICRLSDEGKIESIHWNVLDCSLYNEFGVKIKIIDSGLDTYGMFWAFWNMPDFYNLYNPHISFDVDDGWLNEMMPSPEDMPVEGSYVNMSTKILIKGKMLKIGGMLQLHINANGEITAEVKKGWCESL